MGDAGHATATLGGNVAVNSGTLLRGHGTIGGNVTNAGTVMPGASIGVLTVGGNYTQNSSGTLTIEITPNAASGPGVANDLLRVGGIATLTGGLGIIDDPGTYAVGSRYTLVTARGAAARSPASPIIRCLPPISPRRIIYDANNVDPCWTRRRWPRPTRSLCPIR